MIGRDWKRSTKVAACLLAFGAAAAACSSDGGGTGNDNGFGGAQGGAGPGTGGNGQGGTDIIAGGTTGAGGGSGGGLITGGSTGAGGGSGGIMSADASCATATFQGEQLPLDMYIVFDKSGSMGGDIGGGVSLWDAVKQAFTDFVNAPGGTGTGVGLQFFPPNAGLTQNCGAPPNCAPGCLNLFITCVPGGGGSSCNLNDYLPPAVQIQPLPGAIMPIINALNNEMPGGGTPTLPAMITAVNATTQYAATVPGRKVIIVLATDGEPNDCNSTVGAVAMEAARGLAANPPVSTWVIGLGNIMGLNQIAQAGGGQAVIVNPATASQDFLAAMNSIRGQALGCDYNIDPTAPNGDPVDFSKVSVVYTPPGGTETQVPKTNGEGPGSCDPAQGGWYYDPPQSQGTPSTITICPASCDQVSSGGGTVQLRLGCAPDIVIPA